MEIEAIQEPPATRPILMEAATWDTERAMPVEFPAWVEAVAGGEQNREWAMRVADPRPVSEYEAPRAEHRYVAIVACTRGAMVRTSGDTPLELLTNVDSAVRRWWRSDPARNFDPVPRVASTPWSHVGLAARP